MRRCGKARLIEIYVPAHRNHHDEEVVDLKKGMGIVHALLPQPLDLQLIGKLFTFGIAAIGQAVNR